VVQVLGIVTAEGSEALLLEYVNGPTLATWLHSHRPSLDEAEGLFRGILAGVAEAHRHQLVHRDLKPANVLLARTDGAIVPKVADFGLVKQLGDEVGGTRSGMSLGTPAYMAPEQHRNAKGVDVRADLFSLGCILYHLVTGRSPFVGEDLVDTLTRVAKCRYEAPETLVTDLPVRFRRAIAGCLRPRPEDRLPDCDALLAVLDGEVAVRHDEPTPPAPLPLPSGPPTPGRPWAPVVAGTLLLASSLVLGAAVWWGFGR
jgi:serine/threonine protein kinase